DDHVTFSMRSNTYGEELVLDSIAALLREVQFDFVRVSRLVTTAGQQTGRGQAEFKVTVAGTIQQGMSPRNFAGCPGWSRGSRKLANGVGKINRTPAVGLPQYTMIPTLKYKVPQSASQPPAVEPVSPPPPREMPYRGPRPFLRREPGAGPG